MGGHYRPRIMLEVMRRPKAMGTTIRKEILHVMALERPMTQDFKEVLHVMALERPMTQDYEEVLQAMVVE